MHLEASNELSSTQSRQPAIRHSAGPRLLLIRLLTIAAFLLSWEAFIRVTNAPAYLVPPPAKVAEKFLRIAADGSLLRHTWVTLIEVLGGLALGMLVATLLGYAVARSVAVEQALAPYLVASQAVPIVAIAPLLVIWFGFGMFSKILISALIVFFPILINTVAGVRGVPAELHDLMRSLRASRWQTFLKLEVPAALPVVLAGLKIGATLSVIGAVVGEFAGADAGLGYLISLADGQYDTARMFVGVFMLVALALALYGTVSTVEKYALRWKQAS
jgi:NitT/TauT family transport system permease protein